MKEKSSINQKHKEAQQEKGRNMEAFRKLM